MRKSLADTGNTIYGSRSPRLEVSARTRAPRQENLHTVTDEVLEARCGQDWDLKMPGCPVLGGSQPSVSFIFRILTDSHSKYWGEKPPQGWQGEGGNSHLKINSPCSVLLKNPCPQEKQFYQSLTGVLPKTRRHGWKEICTSSLT